MKFLDSVLVVPAFVVAWLALALLRAEV